jgi:ATP-dependent DNA helicase MPH1
MEGDDFGSDDWGDVDEEALVAAATQAEREQATITSRRLSPAPPPNQCVSGDVPLFLEDDFDDSGDEIPNPPPVATPIRDPPTHQSSTWGALRQSTLFGGRACEPSGSSSQGAVQRSWPLVSTQEPPTHHKVDLEAAKTWVYPTNISHRDYQYSIVSRALFSNVLVALPTGSSRCATIYSESYNPEV